MIDIHTHVIFDVDDGSKSIKESILMLEEMIKQGVSDVILTPHVQSVATKSDRQVQIDNFNILKKEVESKNLNINIHLGAEVRYRSYLDLDYENYTLANSKYLLMEFSTNIKEPVCEIVYDLARKGFIPIVAHAERYLYLNYEDYLKIIQNGGLIQVNCGSFIRTSNRKYSKVANRLLKDNLISFMASDCHDINKRNPNLLKCYNYLNKKVEKQYLNLMFKDNAIKILNNENL